MRHITELITPTSFFLHMYEKAGGHLGVCQGPVVSSRNRKVGVFNKHPKFVIWRLREQSARHEHEASKFLPALSADTVIVVELA